MDPIAIASAVATSLKTLDALGSVLPKKNNVAREQIAFLEHQIRIIEKQSELLGREVKSLRARLGELEDENREPQEKIAVHS